MLRAVAEFLPGEHLLESDVGLTHFADGRTGPVGAVDAPAVVDRDHGGDPKPLFELAATPDQLHVGALTAEAMRTHQGVGLRVVGDEGGLERARALGAVVEGEAGRQTSGQGALARRDDDVAELQGVVLGRGHGGQRERGKEDQRDDDGHESGLHEESFRRTSSTLSPELEQSRQGNI